MLHRPKEVGANTNWSCAAPPVSGFAAGDLTKTISVTVNGDTTIEPDETFFVNLSDTTNSGTIVKRQGIGTVANDDTTGCVVGNISFNDVTITEGITVPDGCAR